MKDKSHDRRQKRAKRRVHIRKRIMGTAEIPRLSVFRSVQNIYGQIIDDMSGKTIISASNVAKTFQEKFGADKKNKTETSQNVGQLLAEMAKEKGIQKVVFDRSGYLYHGRVKALAEGARKGGLVF